MEKLPPSLDEILNTLETIEVVSKLRRDLDTAPYTDEVKASLRLGYGRTMRFLNSTVASWLIEKTTFEMPVSLKIVLDSHQDSSKIIMKIIKIAEARANAYNNGINHLKDE